MSDIRNVPRESAYSNLYPKHDLTYAFSFSAHTRGEIQIKGKYGRRNAKIINNYRAIVVDEKGQAIK